MIAYFAGSDLNSFGTSSSRPIKITTIFCTWLWPQPVRQAPRQTGLDIRYEPPPNQLLSIATDSEICNKKRAGGDFCKSGINTSKVIRHLQALRTTLESRPGPGLHAPSRPKDPPPSRCPAARRPTPGPPPAHILNPSVAERC